MKVEYETVMRPDGFGKKQLYEYSLASDPSFCCDEMKYAWGTKMIRFGYDSHVIEPSPHIDGSFCNWYGHTLNQGAGVYFELPSRDAGGIKALLLEFCPFCAEQITTEEVSRSEITWELKQIEVKVPILHKMEQ